MQYVKQNQSVLVVLGPFVDDVDGKTPREDLTILQSDIRLSKNGAPFAQSAGVSGATHNENGYYRLTLDAADVNSLGRLVVAVLVPGALPVWQEFMICTPNMWDAFFGTSTFTVDAADIWAYATRTLTQPGAEVEAAVRGADLALVNKVGFVATVTNLIIPATWTKIYVTVKTDPKVTDGAATIQVVRSNPNALTDGLTRFLGVAATDTNRAYGSLTVDQPNGTVTIELKDDLQFPASKRGRHTYDIKCLRSDGEALLVAGSAYFDILSTETEAIT